MIPQPDHPGTLYIGFLRLFLVAVSYLLLIFNANEAVPPFIFQKTFSMHEFWWSRRLPSPGTAIWLGLHNAGKE